MTSRAVTVALLGAIACGGSQHTPLSKAGEDKDEGAGELAKASLKLNTPVDDKESARFNDATAARNYSDYGYGGDMYGGDPYGGFGGDPYGGAGYANWRMPQWSYTMPNRAPRYNVSHGLTGAIEGAVTWNGQAPAKLTSPCGPIDNPTLRVSSDKGVRGVVVYIDKVNIGRNTPYYSRPIGVGGMLAKRGCTLVPAAQIVAPLPGSISINGDTQRTKLRVAAGTAPPKVHELQEGGLVQIEVKEGITKVDGEDGKLGAAWVLGLETPYYAITDDAGRYRLDELSPGTYEVTFWQPPIASMNRDGTWAYGAPIVVRRSIRVGAKTAAKLSVTMPGR